MLDSIYHMTLKLFWKHILSIKINLKTYFGRENVRVLSYA